MGCKLRKPKDEPAHSTNAVSSGRITVPMVQNVLLIWLDENIDDNNIDCQNTITQLRYIVNTINTFTDGGQCIHFLENIDNEKVCMIISGTLAQQIVPCVHTMSQVDSIFILCDNIEHHEQWTNDWSKIKGVFTEISSICDALKQAAQQCEQNAISISIMGIDEDVSKKKLDQLDPSFMYTQIMKEILLTIKFEQKHFQEFIVYCRGAFADNEKQLKYVYQLEHKYRDQTPIWWYTLECFLYPMVNRGLRLMDADIIIRLGFFIGDLHRQIEQLHKKQFRGSKPSKSFEVYRGQGMDKTQFEKMAANQGGLLSFNCFLSTSKDRTVSLKFAKRAAKNSDFIGVLFLMAVDPARSTTAFASITDVSSFGSKEEEVLFSMHSAFRIGTITPLGEDHRLFQVELTLTNDSDEDFRKLTDHIRKETFPDSPGWYRLGSALAAIGQPEKAQRVYEVLLEQETDDSGKASIYNQLGNIKNDLGEYEEAIRFYEKDLEISQKSFPLNYPSLATTYNNIGTVYNDMGDYPKALSYFEKALEIRQHSLPPDHLDLAQSYHNIAAVYDAIGDYSEALSYYEKALEIRQQSLPSNHPQLAATYHNIGMVYDGMGNHSKALSSYEKGLEIQQQSLPPDHPDLASSYQGIGIVYQNMNDFPKALSFYEKALEIQQKSLPSNHPNLGDSYNNMGNAYDGMGDYLKALSSYEKALTIRQQSLPPNHPHFAASYYNVGLSYEQLGNYSEACSSFERAVEIAQESLPPNHPRLLYCRKKLADVKRKL